MKKATKFLLIVSLISNIALISLVGVIEYRCRPISLMLERRNLMKVPDVKRPDFWARRGWENTIRKLNLDFDVAFFGNSITCGSDFQQEFPDLRIINLGYPGDNLEGMLHRVKAVKGANPRKIFIMAGTNDLSHISIDTYICRYETLIHTLNDSVPYADIYVQSVLPTNRSMITDYATNEKVRLANEELRNMAEKMHCEYIDLYPLYADSEGELQKSITRDGVHLKPEAYKPWADAIRRFVYE